MEKNRIHQIESGKNTRMSFAGQRNVLEMPNLIEVQTASYEWFLKEGLAEVFRDISPIKDSFTNNQLSFESFELQRDKAKYTIEECKERDATYSAPLRAKVKLVHEATGEISEEEVFMGDLPLMTDTGSFIINGAERVIVSQIVRSPGIYYKVDHDKSGKKLFTNQTIPIRGAWLEYETDSNDNVFVHVDRGAKVAATALVHALGFTDQEINEFFGNDPKIEATLLREKADIKKPEAYRDATTEALDMLYKKLRPGEPFVKESAETLIRNMLFDPKRYDLGRVGRYKFNKKMNLMYRLQGQTLAEDVVDENTGEILAAAGQVLSREDGRRIQNSGVASVLVSVDDGKDSKHEVIVLSNQMVEADDYLSEFGLTAKEAGIRENCAYPVLMGILDKARAEQLSKQELLDLIDENMKELVPTHITVREIITSIGYMLNLEYGIGKTDDIDHLSNRRIRAVGELLQNQYRIGMSRMERVVHERMTTMEMDQVDLKKLINIKPITAAVKEFFGSSQLSQFMDQNNPLSELTHKRRLSALGPGGLSRERAGFEVRDVHYTHYGRMCPIETPEGSNIGLINSLASYARINEYGFIEAPYRVVDHKGNKPVVTDEVVYLAADEEDDFHVAQANTPLDEEGHFLNDAISGRFREETKNYPAEKIDLMDVSPKMVFSVATSMIPFLEHDDANRALMGSNMQRQAVPLMLTEAPVVDTGLADKVAKDSGVCVVCRKAGTVMESAADRIVIKTEDGLQDVYKLKKFERSNQSNSYNQKPIVVMGEKVEAGQVIADGPSTQNGEIALGRNPLIGFMTWEGYNYEDAVLLSERLVQDDVFTSIHIEEYEVEARDTKLGAEEITRDVPGVGDEALKELDENGIIRIGAEVRAGDILVGKVTPKGETEMSPEEKLLRAIFDVKAREVRDTSLRLPHGAYGTVIDAKVFTRENNEELAPGVQKSVCIYIAQKRKISVGDKMAGRHGNKGVVSRVLPVEDMPYLPNGRPLDIVLNPLGVPSRMNIGQVLEIHLSLAAKALGFNVSTPVFDGASEKEIGDLLEVANDYVNTDFEDFKKKYKNSLSKDVMTYLGEHLENRALWEGVPITRDGKVQLRDGRTGELFDSPTTIGHMHYLKLHHLVDDKIHARSTGPYSLVTQQPLGGKAQFGGQRFGEMEVWALEAYGASYTLQEILTVKSDDLVGRVRSYEAIVKGENIPTAGVPESFKVLVKELQSLALDVQVLDENNEKVKISECSEYGNTNINQFIYEDDRRSSKEKDYRSAGFSIQSFNSMGELEEVAEENTGEESSDEE